MAAIPPTTGSSNTAVEAVLFDVGGVFMVPDPFEIGPMLADHGAQTDEAALVRAHFAASWALDDAGGDWLAYHGAYVAAAGVEGAEQTRAAATLSEGLDHWMWRHPVPGARAALASLVDAGVPVGVVSNAAGQVEGELAAQAICQVGPGDGVAVTCVVDSHVVGVSKPDPAIFGPALETLGVQASDRVLYVGDTVTYDIAGARNAGLRGLLHDPWGFHARCPHASDPALVGDLADLAELVGRVS